MGVTFVHINDDDHKDELESLALIEKISKDKGLRKKDKFWVDLILKYIASIYDNISCKERQILRTKNEREIKEFIRNKLETNDKFTETYFLTVDLETQNEHSSLLGFYDIKIRSSLWDKYFSFECKCLNNNKISILEYVYNPNKSKNKKRYEDGGIYRFLINKYSTDLEFGGMIGFVQCGECQNIEQAIFNQIKDLKLNINDNYFGLLNEEGIVKTKNPNCFQSTHSRYDISEKRMCKPIKIYHFFYDFT